MAIIQKRADELKPGDILDFGHGRYVVTNLSDVPGRVFVAAIYGESHFMWEQFDPNLELQVESPDLTPAQQHAEDLADTLRKLVDSLDNGVMYHAHAVQPMKNAHALLDKIKPPEPPTLAEALSVIQQMSINDTDDFTEGMEKGAKLLDRARRSGVLK